MAEHQNSGIWFVLDKIQKDIDKIDSKWDEYVVKQAVLVTKLSENLIGLSQRVSELNKLLTEDNGKPSVVTQVESVNIQLTAIKSKVDKMQENLRSIEGHVGVKQKTALERWKTIGKIVGLATLIAPGILSFFGLAAS